MIHKILLLLIFCITISKVYCQNTDPQEFDTTIKWNLDSDVVKKSLPYNQYIQFKITSTKVPLEQVSSVFVLVHKGKKNSEESLKYYVNNSTGLFNKHLLSKNFYMLDIKDYDDATKTLTVEMVKDNFNYNSTRSNYVLLPSRAYSFYFFTKDAKGDKLLEKVKEYLDACNSNSPTKATLFTDIQTKKMDIYNNVNSQKYGKKGFVTSFLQPYLQTKDSKDTSHIVDTTLIDEYRNKIYQYDHIIDSLKHRRDSKFNTLKCSYNNFYDDSLSNIIEKYLSIIISKESCSSNLPCSTDRCRLYKLVMVLKQSYKDTSLKQIRDGNVTFTDLSNILFTGNKDLTPKQKLNNIDSSLQQLNDLKLYLNNLFINDCKLANCCDSILNKNLSHFFDSASSTYITSIECFIKNLEISKTYSTVLAQKLLEKDNAVKNVRFFYVTTKISNANTYIYGLEQRTKLYVIPAFGYAVYGFQKGFTSFTPYTALSISLSPLNDSIKYRELRGKTLAQRLTFLTGITLASLQENNKRDNLFANNSNLITGFGYKLGHIVSLNGGVIWFKKEDPNPFIVTKKIAATPYVSFAINLKLKTLWEGFTNLLPIK